MSRVLVYVTLTLAIAMAAIVPALFSSSTTSLASMMLVAGLFALSYALSAGQAGLLSFGHATFLGTGLFTAIHVMRMTEAGIISVPTPLVPLFGGVMGAAAAFLVGYFAARRAGFYFAMITFAIGELIFALSPTMPGVFGGESGFTAMRMPWLGITFATDAQVYYLVLAWAVACAGLLYAFSRTMFGRLTVALRENEERVAFLGYNTHWSKVAVFSISGLFSGIAGSLMGLATEGASSAVFSMHTSAAVVLQTFIGGATTFLGPAIGAALLTLMQSMVSDVTRLWLLYQGLIFIAVVLFVPDGLFKGLLDQVERLRSEGPRALVGMVVTLVGVSLVSVAVVFVCETLAVVFQRLNFISAEAGTVLAPINLFGVDWSPASPVTWLFPVVLLAAGVYILRRRGGADENGAVVVSESREGAA